MTGERRDRADERAAELQRESNDQDLKDPEGDDQIRRKSEETAVEPE